MFEEPKAKTTNRNLAQGLNRNISQISELGNILWRHLSESSQMADQSDSAARQQALKTLSLGTAQLSFISRQFLSQSSMDAKSDLALIPLSLDLSPEQEINLSSITQGRLNALQLFQQLPDYLRTKPMPEVEKLCDGMLESAGESSMGNC